MRIRTLAIAAFVAALVVPSIALAQADPLVGTWKVNIAKSKYSGAAPKSSTLKAVANADGTLTQTTDTVLATGAPVHYEITFKFDGKDYPYKGANPNADAASYKRVDKNTIDVTGKKGGKPTVTTHTVISADGKTRTSTQTGVDAQGQKVTNTIVYDKQ